MTAASMMLTRGDPILRQAVEEFTYSVLDYCPNLTDIVEQYIHTTSHHYYPSGNLHIACQLTFGTMNGTYDSWYEDGKPICHMTYRDGKKHGMQTLWTSDGHLHSRRTYVNDEQHGDAWEWYSNNKLFCHENYVRGKRHGEYTEWHRNGGKKRERIYEDGQIVGPAREWDDDGRLVEETHYGEESTLWARVEDAERILNHSLVAAIEAGDAGDAKDRCSFM